MLQDLTRFADSKKHTSGTKRLWTQRYSKCQDSQTHDMTHRDTVQMKEKKCSLVPFGASSSRLVLKLLHFCTIHVVPEPSDGYHQSKWSDCSTLWTAMNPRSCPPRAREEQGSIHVCAMWSTTSFHILSDLPVFSILWSSVKMCERLSTGIYRVRSVRSQSHLQVMESPGHLADLWRLAAGLGRGPQDAWKVSKSSRSKPNPQTNKEIYSGYISQRFKNKPLPTSHGTNIN